MKKVKLYGLDPARLQPLPAGGSYKKTDEVEAMMDDGTWVKGTIIGIKKGKYTFQSDEKKYPTRSNGEFLLQKPFSGSNMKDVKLSVRSRQFFERHATGRSSVAGSNTQMKVRNGKLGD